MSAYLTAVLADSPLDYWRCADPAVGRLVSIGSQLIDLAPQQHLNPVFGYSGPVSDGGSIYMSYTPCYVTPYAHGSTFTLEAWIWVGFEGQGEEVLLSVGRGTGMAAVYLDSGIPPALHFGIFGGVYSGAFTITQQRWHHVALRYNGTDLQLVLDGTQVGTLTTSASSALGSVNVGPQGPGASAIWFSEAAFYGSAITDTRLAAHFAAADQTSLRPAVNDLLTEILNAVRQVKTTPGQV